MRSKHTTQPSRACKPGSRLTRETNQPGTTSAAVSHALTTKYVHDDSATLTCAPGAGHKAAPKYVRTRWRTGQPMPGLPYSYIVVGL